jgi:hypothetical protein
MGCDPEFYLTKDGIPISAHDLVPGTKKEPHPLKCGGAVQVDGVAVEFNIPPSSTSKEFADNIEAALFEIRMMIPKKYTFNFKPFVEFDSLYFKELPPPVKELGCDPDYNAYSDGAQQESPSIFADHPMRCFGGHLHFGWGSKLEGEGHMDDCVVFVKAMEAYQPYPYYDTLYSISQKRRAIYGNSGAFRPKPYGVEWRSPDNTWLAAGPTTWKYMFDITKSVFHTMTEGKSDLCQPVRPVAKTTFTM